MVFCRHDYRVDYTRKDKVCTKCGKRSSGVGKIKRKRGNRRGELTKREVQLILDNKPGSTSGVVDDIPSPASGVVDSKPPTPTPPPTDKVPSRIMAKTCHACGGTLAWPGTYRCRYCKNTYCADHRVAENHDCPKVVAARHIKRDYLRKRGVNITTGCTWPCAAPVDTAPTLSL